MLCLSTCGRPARSSLRVLWRPFPLSYAREAGTMSGGRIDSGIAQMRNEEVMPTTTVKMMPSEKKSPNLRRSAGK
eukprot:1232985-Pleurochrysis_carterae.AAC.1